MKTSIPDTRAVAPFHLGGLGLSDVTVIRWSAFIASTRQTATRVNLGFPADDEADVCAWLHHRPGFAAALDALATLAAGPTGNVADAREDLAKIAVSAGKGVQRELTAYVSSAIAERALDMEPDPLMEAYGRSGRAAESWCPFELTTSPPSELGDDAFVAALLLRLGYPAHPDRTSCALCHAPAGPSMVHDLNCNALTNASVTRQHSAVQRAFCKGVHDLRIPGVEVAEDAPLYAHHFTPKFAATAANQTIVKADVAVELPPSNAEPGQQYLVDFIVTGPNQQNLAAARRTTGAMAEAAERGKVTNVKTRYHVPPATERKLSPFGVEVTGAFGAHTRGVCVPRS